MNDEYCFKTTYKRQIMDFALAVSMSNCSLLNVMVFNSGLNMILIMRLILQGGCSPQRYSWGFCSNETIFQPICSILAICARMDGLQLFGYVSQLFGPFSHPCIQGKLLALSFLTICTSIIIFFMILNLSAGKQDAFMFLIIFQV